MVTSELQPWMVREFSPVGVALDSVSSAESYDRNQGTQATVDDALLDRLGVGHGTVLVDLGTGTGSLPTRAALRGAVAHAVDVSTNSTYVCRYGHFRAAGAPARRRFAKRPHRRGWWGLLQLGRQFLRPEAATIERRAT